jgi:hypothetical protein
MNWSEIFVTSGLTTVAMTVLAFLLREWISVRLKESISAEYKKAFEEFKQQLGWEQKRRLQAAEVVDFFSLWRGLHKYDKTKDENLVRYEVQKKYWQIALWLDAPVLRAVNQAIASSDDPGITHKVALIAVRRLFVGDDDPIQPQDLYHWEPVSIDKASEPITENPKPKT